MINNGLRVLLLLWQTLSIPIFSTRTISELPKPSTNNGIIIVEWIQFSLLASPQFHGDARSPFFVLLESSQYGGYFRTISRLLFQVSPKNSAANKFNKVIACVGSR